MGPKSAAVLALLTAATAPALAASASSHIPEAWREAIAAGAMPGIGTYSVALPPTLETVPTRGVNSVVSEYRSPNLTLLLELGAHGSDVSQPCRRAMRCTKAAVAVAGIGGRRIRYYVPDPDGELPWRATYVIPLPAVPESPRRISLTVRAECRTVAACDLADRIVRTIRFVPKP